MTSQQGITTDAEFRHNLVALLPRLRRFCAGLAGGPDQGDDLVQACVERALRHADQWQPGTRLDSWLYRIAQNIHIDQIRASKVRGIPVDLDTIANDGGEDGRAIVEHRSDLSAAAAAMAQLPEEQRAVLTLVVLDGMAYRDAAETLGIPIGSVMSRLSRARARIDATLRGQSRIEDDDA